MASLFGFTTITNPFSSSFISYPSGSRYTAVTRLPPTIIFSVTAVRACPIHVFESSPNASIKPFKEVFASSVVAEGMSGVAVSSPLEMRVNAEKVSVSIEKPMSKMVVHAPSDPQEQFICDSCQ